MPNIDYLKSPGLRKMYSQFLRRKKVCPYHDGTWYKLDKKTNSVVMNYKPLKTARNFHYSQAKHRAFGGGYGDGKSLSLCQEAVALAHEFPRSLGLVGAATFPQLRDATRKTFLDICPPELIAKFQRTENNLFFKNGSQIMFRSLTAINEEDKVRFKNMNLGWFMMDQAEGIEEDVWKLLASRLRQAHGPRRSVICFNMEGHNWIWKKFVQDVKKGKVDPADFMLFVAKSIENPYLPEDYIFHLLTDYPEEWVERYVEGSFDVFKGKIFKDFDEQIHVVRQFDPPPSWTRYRSIDWGQNNPYACLWAAVNPEGDIYIYGETYEKGLTVPGQAAQIRGSMFNEYKDDSGATHKHPIMWTTIDPSTNRRDPVTGITLKNMYDSNGVPTTNGNNDVNASLDRIAQLIRSPSPTIRIMDNCYNLIEEIQNYRYQNKRNEDGMEKPQKVKDHAIDALRYLVMSNPFYSDPNSNDSEEEMLERFWRDDITGY